MLNLSLPKTATAPFCPNAVGGTVTVLPSENKWRRLLAFLGPGLLVAVGYMNPGNWATDIEGGAKFGYLLLSVIFLSNLMAMLLQSLCVRLGIVTGIEDAYRLLAPLLGTGLASVLFGIALLASGQSSTFTGTLAGQIVMEGFLDWWIPCWLRRLITRMLAIAPALVGIIIFGEQSVGKMLVLS